MSRLMHRSVRIGKYTIPALLLLALVTGTVAATVYVVLTFNASLTVQANPRVSFYNWTAAAKVNTFTESFNIFPSVTTINTNASCGIYSLTAGTSYLRISSISTPGNIQEVNMTIVGTAVQVLWTSGGGLPTSWQTFSTSADTYYTIWIEVEAKAGATGSSDITFEMKVENP
jgi:hypothetical protein